MRQIQRDRAYDAKIRSSQSYFEVTIPDLTTALSTPARQCGIAGEQRPLPSFARRPAAVDKKGDLATLNEVGYQLRI